MASKKQSKLIEEYESKGYYVINLVRTNKNGIPDLLCLKKGEEPIFIESKELNDTVKPLQRFRISELKKRGFIAFVNNQDNESI